MKKINYSINPEPVMKRALENPKLTVINIRRKSPADGSLFNEAAIKLTTIRFDELIKWGPRVQSQNVWIELIYNISQDRFYARGANMGIHSCGETHLQLKHGSVVSKGSEYKCRRCNQIITDFVAETEAVKLLGFGDAVNQSDVLDALRLYLSQNQYRVEEKMIIDKNQNDKLMHEFNQEQREYIVEQINNFITRTRSAKVDNNMPEEEQRQETPSSEDQAI